MHNLNLKTLREANLKRIPEYRNKQGGKAHSKADGSDWCPAQWLNALVGEIGEYADALMAVEAEGLTAENQINIANELADIQTYLDLNAARAYDQSNYIGHKISAPEAFLSFMVAVGSYCNNRKKYERGDYEDREEYYAAASRGVLRIYEQLDRMVQTLRNDVMVNVDSHPEGVDLAKATEEKFNEVSERVGSYQFIHNDEVIRQLTHPIHED
jgi:NTP pyrophosphatase (non-canonical NTP hydrolase)